MAALTSNEPADQPGFEDGDTTVVAAITFYGYFGSVDGTDASSPG